MTVIRVNPSSVVGYGNKAETTFGEMHTSLTNLVNQVVNVRYFGPNAVKFKTDIGTIAADFANALHKDMAKMAEAVKASTTAIAQSLGGQAITIQVSPKAITPPVPPTVDYVDVDTSALESLTGTVDSRFAELNSGLAANLSALSSTDWEGKAKEAAVQVVTTFTNSAKTKCTEAQTKINGFINKQVEVATSADK